MRCNAYIRYVDDLLLFAENKETLWEWRDAVADRLNRFRLRLHETAQARPVEEGIPFLGFVVFPHRRRLKSRKGLHFRRKLIHLLEERRQGRRTPQEVTVRVRGWVNHVRYANSIGLRKAVLRAAFAITDRGAEITERTVKN